MVLDGYKKVLKVRIFQKVLEFVGKILIKILILK